MEKSRNCNIATTLAAITAVTVNVATGHLGGRSSRITTIPLGTNMSTT